jgi:predicted outer membrane repeat protein
VLGNVAKSAFGGGIYVSTTGGIVITSALFRGNLAGVNGGGLSIKGDATLTTVSVLENVASFLNGKGGGIHVVLGTVVIARSTVTGNVAGTGGGIFDGGDTTLDLATKVIGNSARTDPNTSGI